LADVYYYNAFSIWSLIPNLIACVVGTRPNFVKMSPVIQELQRRGLPHFLVHTGQHYNQQMSTIFFEELAMPRPDIYLGVGSGSHAEQTARIMIGFEAVCIERQPMLVIVAGDVNSTLACALAAAKLHIPVAHVEAGLRSFDRAMPEEINRILTDQLATLLFTTEASAITHLLNEGIDSTNIYEVGNTMIDTLHTHLDKALRQQPWQTYGFEPENYALVTFHRPANVDERSAVVELASALSRLAEHMPVLFPIHPRTLANGGGLWESVPGIHIVEPLGYLEFLGLMARARTVITDSGGVQEETTALGVPCVTVRASTERPVTVTEGTNRLVGVSADDIVQAALSRTSKTGHIPPLWDGHAAKRIGDVIEDWYKKQHLA
jgi:UDP-N-acetylglucosamine 2-epimerase (non-hydrolysing)